MRLLSALISPHDQTGILRPPRRHFIRTQAIKGSLGLAEDPSRFSIACRQIGPIAVDIGKLPEEAQVYSEKTSIFFKHTHVYRIPDQKRNTLVYLAISDKIINGSPQNAISTVPIMKWEK